MKNFNLKSAAKALVAASALAASSAFATVATTDNFYEFSNTVLGWANGGLGTGLAVTAVIIGAAIGVGKGSPMAALAGIATAAFLKWGPIIIQTLLGATL